MRTVLLLIGSNVFMTFAWYLHLKKEYVQIPLWKVVLGSWMIAFFEYCLQVPANRIGQEVEGFSPSQLKIIQEAITLVVFSIFSITVLHRPITPRAMVAFALVFAAVAVAAGDRSDSEKPAETNAGTATGGTP